MDVFEMIVVVMGVNRSVAPQNVGISAEFGPQMDGRNIFGG